MPTDQQHSGATRNSPEDTFPPGPEGPGFQARSPANRIHNAVRTLGPEGWHKPWSGSNGGSCVEVRKLPDGRFAVRQSTDPEGPALVFTQIELDVFAQGWELGQAELLAS